MSKLLKLNLKIIKFSAPINTSMRKTLFIVFLFVACSNPDNHGDLSIFKTPTSDQFDKWSNIDSVYKSTIKEMVDVYKRQLSNPIEHDAIIKNEKIVTILFMI